MRLLAGTSGYAYKEWKGSFYPKDQSNDSMLSFYAGKFGTVEINNTFYRMPSERVLVQWAEQVPDGFRFVLKASRRITHMQRLKNVEDPLSYLINNASLLGSKLGAMLFQLPPNMKKNLERLTTFLALLPDGWPAALEFRHDSWFDDEVYDALRSSGAALCVADTAEGPSCSSSTKTKGRDRLWLGASSMSSPPEDYRPASFSKRLHWAAVAGITESRPIRTSARSLNAGSALIVFSSTGRGSRSAAARSTTTSLGSSCSGSP